jgi:membrane-associated phospholipid phosphatase
MGLLRQAMVYYPYVFHPITVLGVGIALLIYLEWDRQDADAGALWRRLGALAGAGLLSLAPTAAFMLVTGKGPMQTTRGNAWQIDSLVASGLFIVAGLLWAVWWWYDWGSLVPDGMETLAAVTAPYMVLSPVWNVSGHVIIALMPTLYLTLVDRRFWPSLAIPLVMVPNRILLGTHTWAQTIGGFLIAAVVVVGLTRLQTGDLVRWDARSPTS